MNGEQYYHSIEIVDAARQSLDAKKAEKLEEVRGRARVLENGMQEIADRIAQIAGYPENGRVIADFEQQVGEEFMTPEISALVSEARRAAALLKVLDGNFEPAAARPKKSARAERAHDVIARPERPKQSSLPRGSWAGAQNDSKIDAPSPAPIHTPRQTEIQTRLASVSVRTEVPRPGDQPLHRVYRAPEQAHPAPTPPPRPAAAPRPSPPREVFRKVPRHPAAAEAQRAAEVHTGPIGIEERSAARDRFYNILQRIMDDPDNFISAIREARDLFERYAGKFDNAFRAQVESFCGAYNEAAHRRTDLPQDMADRVRGKFPELHLPEGGNRSRIVETAQPERVLIEDDISTKTVLNDLATERIEERERKVGYVRKRIMGIARTGGEVSASEAELAMKGIHISRFTIIPAIDWLVENGFLQILREEDNGTKVYTPTGKRYDPKEHAVPRAAPQVEKEPAVEEGGTSMPAAPTPQSSPNALRPIDPRDKIKLDAYDDVILRKAHSSGSITDESVFARTFRMDKNAYKIRLRALVERGLLRKQDDGENARFFPA